MPDRIASEVKPAPQAKPLRDRQAAALRENIARRKKQLKARAEGSRDDAKRGS
jgi:hypothetical protein